MNDYTYDNDPQYNHEENSKNDYDNDSDNVTPWFSGAQLVIAQIIVCTVIILLFVIFKSVNPKIFEVASNWYKEKLNDSLIINDNIDDYKETISNIINGTAFSNRSSFLNIATMTKNELGHPICLTTNVSPPLSKGLLSSKFGYRNLNGENKMHYGLDIATDENQPIYPILPGTVKTVNEDEFYGKYVILDHGNDISTLYAHCNSFNVNQGDNVYLNKPIAYVGNTGRSTGNHLHIELRVADKSYDPEPFLKGLYDNI